MARLVSKIYSEALFDYAKENGTLDNNLTIIDDARDVISVFTNSIDLKDFLKNPRITVDEKITFIRDLFDEKIFKGSKKKIVDLILIMIEKGRQDYIVSAFSDFIDLALQYKNIGKASVWSASELTDDEKKVLNEKLVKTTKYDSFVIDYIVDETLIAGIKIKINDKVFDNTYKSKMANISKSLRGLKI